MAADFSGSAYTRNMQVAGSFGKLGLLTYVTSRHGRQ